MRIMISCGEPSGDLYAGALVAEILKRQPSADIFGFGGQRLADLIRVRQPRATLLREHGLDPTAPTVALLPGSRANELRQIVPDMAAALPLIRARVPGVQFIVARAPNLRDELFAPMM